MKSILLSRVPTASVAAVGGWRLAIGEYVHQGLPLRWLVSEILFVN